MGHGTLRRRTTGTMLDSVTSRVERLERRFEIPDKIEMVKITADADALDGNLDDSAKVVYAGDGRFEHLVADDLDGWVLKRAEAGISTAAGTNVVEVMLYHERLAANMLSTPITIDVGERSSYFATTPSVVDDTNAAVQEGDWIRVDVDVGDDEAMGLVIVLTWRFPPPS